MNINMSLNLKTIIVKGLPGHMIRRILPVEIAVGITDTEIAYANINTILFLPTGDGGTLVVFDVKSEWNYKTDAGAEELFGYLSGSGGPALIERA